MKKNEILNSLTRRFHGAGLKLKQHSPEILVVAGVVGMVTSAVMACKATTKVSPILEEAKDKIDNIHVVIEKDAASQDPKYTDKEAKKALTIAYAKTGLELVKLYGPSVALGTLSITSIFASNNILRKRNVALAAAYTIVDKSFKNYRSRVVERFGKALDRELRYDLKAVEVEEKVVDENGEEKTQTRVITTVNPNQVFCSEYARFFDDGCKGWTDDSEANLIFLRQVQNFVNDKLRAQGYLFLNDVYRELGIRPTREGHVVGWIYNEENREGDNFIDFGIYDQYNEKARDFVNGYENVILLDFNVDGVIYGRDDIWLKNL
ncbi:DUF6353 family protein [Fibrobacter sp.]|uniref:DUF6353 family protein n=1 Tax=Fibrobacter sp. TaxID=35828 RepID=UPI00388EB05D